jgi:hypothetical protein
MEVVEVNVNSFRHDGTHEGEAFRGQAVGSRRIGTCIPLDTGKINPVKVGESVQATAHKSSSGSSSAIRVRISCINVGVIVEI